jgi:PAS domain S-box-containing protein
MLSQILNTDSYALTIHAASSMLVGTAIAVLGLYVLIRERGSRTGIIFWVFTLCISIWLVAFGAAYASLQEPQALFWIRFSQMGVVFIPVTIVMLASTVVQRVDDYRKLIRTSAALSTLFCLGVVFTDLHIRGIYRYFWGYYPKYGLLGAFFLAYFFGIMIYVLRLYWLEYRRSADDRRKKRLQGLLIAFSIAYLASVDFLAAFGVPLYPFGFVPVIFFLFITVYVITRYRLVDITPELAAGQVLETMQGAVVVVDLEGKIRVVNRVAQEMFDCQKSELYGKDLSSLLDLPAEIRGRDSIEESVSSREITWAGKDGRESVVSISASPLTDRHNTPVGLVYVAHDITVRKQAEESLKKRNAFIETVLDNLPIGLAVNTIADGSSMYLNAKFEEIYGWPKNVLVDVEQFFDHVYPDPVQRGAVKERIMADIAGGDPQKMRWENVAISDQAGKTKHVTAVNIPLFEQGLMISTVQDFTDRRNAESALAGSERRYKRLVESVTDYIYTVKVENGRPVLLKHGPGCLSVTGYAPEEYDADPKLMDRIVHAGDRDAVMEYAAKMLSGHPVARLEYRIIHKDGSLRWVRNTAVPRFDNDEKLLDYDGLITDITPLKQLEAQLRQAQKMEAVGQLAGGVAHDFNNILTAIVGYGNLLVMKLPENDALSSYTRQILASAQRAAHLTQSLLAFSRKQAVELKPVDVNAVIGQVEKLLARIIGEDIEFKTKLTAGDLPVMADSGQIEQVMMNLATNARDAMPNGGLLTIEAGAFEMGEDFLADHAYGKPGAYALITVSDTGDGMNEEVRAKIFEPFFTTKEVGKGTGLGLAMAYGIIKQHKGYIDVSSEPGMGAKFNIYLPLIVHAVPEAARSSGAVMRRGTETILLAEDDAEVRGVMRIVLEDYGYKVIEAVDGEDAVRKFRELQRVDLIVSDVIMPKKNGKEMHQEIKKLRPGMKALFTSGYTAAMALKEGVLEPGAALVSKPVSPAEFLQKVRDVLDKQ